MNLNVLDKVFQKVKSHLISKSKYSPHIVKSVPLKPKYPLVVVSEIDNYEIERTTLNEEIIDGYIYEFDIYAANKEEGSNKIAGVEIARELAGLIDEVMKSGGAKRMFARPTPNVARTLFRMTMRYRIN